MIWFISVITVIILFGAFGIYVAWKTEKAFEDRSKNDGGSNA